MYLIYCFVLPLDYMLTITFSTACSNGARPHTISDPSHSFLFYIRILPSVCFPITPYHRLRPIPSRTTSLLRFVIDSTKCAKRDMRAPKIGRDTARRGRGCGCCSGGCWQGEGNGTAGRGSFEGGLGGTEGKRRSEVTG